MRRNKRPDLTLDLVHKRNQQFAKLFARLKDPVSLMQFYSGMSSIYKRYTLNCRYDHLTIRALLYLYDNHMFWRVELAKLLDVDEKTAKAVFLSLQIRDLVFAQVADKSNHKITITLSATGHLLIRSVQREVAALMVAVMGNGRKGRSKKKAPPIKAGHRIIG